MDGYQRVASVFGGIVPDCVPVGELALDRDLVALLAEGAGGAGGDLARAASVLGVDMIGAPVGDPGFDRLIEGVAGGNRFVWALVDGPLQALTGELGMEAAFSLLARPGDAANHLERCGALARAAADHALELGVDGVAVGEDLAGAGGPLIGPHTVSEVLLPRWRELVTDIGRVRTRRRDRPRVILHSDGDIRPLIGLIRAAGFDGIHSLEPEAGMDPAEMLNRGLTLVGGLSIPGLARESDLIARARRLGRLAAGGGLIVGTTTAIVPSFVRPEQLQLAYRQARGAWDATHHDR